MDLTFWLYLLVLALGFVAIAIALRSPALGIALWVLVYPLVANLAVPEGLEKIPPTRVVSLILCLACLPLLGSKDSMAKVRAPVALYAAFLVSAFLSSLISPLGMQATQRVLTYGEPIAWLLLGVAAARSRLDDRGTTLLLAATALSFIGVLLVSVPELLTQSNPLLATGIARTTGDYMEDRRLGFTGRLVGTLGQPVYAGMYGVIVIGAVLALLADGRVKAAAQWALALLGVAAFGFVVLTGTRGAIAGLVVLAFLGISAAWRSSRARIFGTALVLLISVAAMSPVIRTFLDESIRVDEPSSSAANVVGRLALTKRMLDVFASNPVFGVGPGYFQKVVDEPGQIDTEGLGGIENQYATLLAENGLLGCALFVAFLGVLAMRGLSQRGHDPTSRSTLDRWSGAAIGAIGIMGISAFVLTTIPMFHALVLGGTCLAGTGGGKR